MLDLLEINKKIISIAEEVVDEVKENYLDKGLIDLTCVNYENNELLFNLTWGSKIDFVRLYIRFWKDQEIDWNIIKDRLKKSVNNFIEYKYLHNPDIIGFFEEEMIQKPKGE